MCLLFEWAKLTCVCSADTVAVYYNTVGKPQTGFTDYTLFVGPELVPADAPMIHVQSLSDVPSVLVSIYGGTAVAPQRPSGAPHASSSTMREFADGAAELSLPVGADVASFYIFFHCVSHNSRTRILLQ